MATEPFAFPILTADGVVLQIAEDKLHILLIKRGYEPFLDAWALPGGYIPSHESSRQALERVLLEKTGVSTTKLRLVGQPYAFDMPGRDPRGYAITIMYIGLGRGITPATHETMANLQEPTFFPITELPELAYDHASIVSFAHDQLKRLAAQTNIVAALMPAHFTLSELQTAYEAIYCKKLDKRNFRKKILGFNLIEATEDKARDGAHRPAQLYKFQKNEPDDSTADF